jgi:uncharacterized membrane protein
MSRSQSITRALLRSTLVGVVAGMRSQVPLALLSRNAAIYGPDFLGKRWVAVNLYLSAAGEMIVDKLPFVPSRLNPGPIAGRLMFGAASAAVLSRRAGTPIVAGVATGAVGALAGSYAGYHARAWLGKTTGMPDPIWAVVEDGAAVLIGMAATR